MEVPAAALILLPFTLMGKADADREAKETRTCRDLGVRPMAYGRDNIIRLEHGANTSILDTYLELPVLRAVNFCT